MLGFCQNTMGSSMEEIFEITDFTCVTDFERFVADLECRIREWQLSPESSRDGVRPKNEKDDLRTVKFDSRFEFLAYGEKAYFKITYVFPDTTTTSSLAGQKVVEKEKLDDKSGADSYLPQCVFDMVEPGFDFAHESVSMGHQVVRYFGLRRFVVIEPSSFASESSIISDDSFIGLILSAIALATSNTGCDIPILLQIGDRWRWLFTGLCQNDNVRTHYEMVQLRRAPQKCCHLSGILDMFKEQVACRSASLPPVKVSVRITYEFKESFESGWPSDMEAQSPPEKIRGVKELARLPFGAIQGVVDALYLSATWLNLNEDVLVENGVYSDLDPLGAPFWSCTADFVDNNVMLMNEALQGFLKLLLCYLKVDDILGPSITEVPAAASALSRLTKSTWIGEITIPQSASKVLAAASSPAKEKGPLDDTDLGQLLEFLFPDAELDNKGNNSPDVIHPSTANKVVEPQQVSTSGPPGTAVTVDQKVVKGQTDRLIPPNSSESKSGELETLLKKAKAAPRDSLTSRLALVVCHLIGSMQGQETVCHIWREFVLELRYRWENGIALLGFGPSNPDFRYCLFHQKLQMLNCCILQKLKRQKRMQLSSTGSFSSPTAGDEFFDCFEDTKEMDLDVVLKPEGRLRPLGKKTFLMENHTELVYIPITQLFLPLMCLFYFHDPAPLTEDTVEEYGNALTNLDTSLARAKMQTPSLLSDMQAFKAANPKALMEDFVRWYSPRDWIEEVDPETGIVTGILSERMSVPGVLWREVWDNARPIPVSRQRRLFDDTKEAEKILHWFQEMPISDIARHLMPSLFLCSIFQLNEEAGIVNKLLTEKWKDVATHFAQASMGQTDSAYEDLRALLSEIECLISRHRTLVGLLSSNVVPNENDDHQIDADSELQQFALDLLADKDVKILGSSRGFIGQVLMNMFTKDESSATSSSVSFPPFYSKEYILRWMVPRPQSKSRSCPQRCYVRLKNNEFRAASAFTEDVVFFLPDKM